MGDVESSNNKIESHRSTLGKILYILQIILRQIDHIPVILIILLKICEDQQACVRAVGEV